MLIGLIILSSFNGILRIYCPHESGYKVDDSYLEQNLDKPILQIALGNFIAY